MNLKKVLTGCLVLLLMLIVSACGSDDVSGSGKVTELDLKEVKAFKDDKKTGFLYVKSPLDSDKESDRMQLREIERGAEAEKIDFYVFDGKELPESEFYENDISKKILEQYTGTFAFYQDGKMKEELDFTDFSEDEIPSEVKKFIKDVKYDYFK